MTTSAGTDPSGASGALAAEVDRLSARLTDLENRERIRALLYRNARGMDRADADLVRSTYHEDAYEIHWETFTGNGHEFADFIAAEIATTRAVTHTITNPLIELDGDRAFCESSYTARTLIDRVPDLGGWIEHVVWGRYLDIVEQRDGLWKILHRQLARDGGRRLIVTEPLAPAEHTRSRADRTDPSYQKWSLVDFRPPMQRGGVGMFTAQSTINSV